METATIQCGESIGEAAAAFETFFWDDAERFALWLGEKFSRRIHPFERRVIEVELESLAEFTAKKTDDRKERRQLALL